MGCFTGMFTNLTSLHFRHICMRPYFTFDCKIINWLLKGRRNDEQISSFFSFLLSFPAHLVLLLLQLLDQHPCNKCIQLTCMLTLPPQTTITITYSPALIIIIACFLLQTSWDEREKLGWPFTFFFFSPLLNTLECNCTWKKDKEFFQGVNDNEWACLYDDGTGAI